MINNLNGTPSVNPVKALILLFTAALLFGLSACGTPKSENPRETYLGTSDSKSPKTEKQSTRSVRKTDIKKPKWEDFEIEVASGEEKAGAGETAAQTAKEEVPVEVAAAEPKETPPRTVKEKRPTPMEEKPPQEEPETDPLSQWEQDLINDMENVKKNKKARLGLNKVDLVEDLPVADEIQLGEGVAARILAQTQEHENEKLWEYVSFVGISLAENSLRNDLAYYFIVLDAPDDINAFAAPGGFIFITSGAIRFCENEAEMAAILAHELAHIGHRHGIQMLDLSKYREKMKHIVREMDDAFGRETVFEEDPAWIKEMEKELDKVADQSFQRLLNPFSQAMEYEADREGLRILKEAGYNPYAAITVLERLRKVTGETPAYANALQSHPPTSERINSLKEMGPTNRGKVHKDRFRKYAGSLK